MSNDQDSALPFDLPSGWPVTSVGEQFFLILGKMLDAEKNVGVSKPYLGNRSVQWGRVDIDDLSLIKLTQADLRHYRLAEGDLLVCEGGDIGRSAIWRGQLEECYFQKALHRVRPRGGFIPVLLRYLLEYYSKTGFLLNFATQTSIAHLPKDKFEVLPLPHPPLEEQQAIAEALSDADALIEGLERLIAKKRLIKQGAMQDLLTAKRRLPGFSGEWKPLNLAASSHLKARIGWQGLTTQEYLKFGEYTLVTGTDIHSGKINWRGCVFVDKWRFVQDRNIQLQNGDILLTKDGTIGKVARVSDLPGPATLNSGVFVIRPKNESYHSGFAFHILSSSIFEEFLAKLTAGSTIVHLYQKDLVTFVFDAPDIEEQIEISVVLDEMDAEIQTLETRLEKARFVKEGMMQNLLTGRIRLV